MKLFRPLSVRCWPAVAVAVCVTLAPLVLAPLTSAHEEPGEESAQPLPPTRLEVWIQGAQEVEKASIPLVEEGTFAVRFALEKHAMPELLHHELPLVLRGEVVVSGRVRMVDRVKVVVGDAAQSIDNGTSSFVVDVRPEILARLVGTEELALTKSGWQKSYEAEPGEVVEIALPSPQGKVAISTEGMTWGELPEGIRETSEGRGLFFEIAKLTEDLEISVVLRVTGEGPAGSTPGRFR